MLEILLAPLRAEVGACRASLGAAAPGVDDVKFQTSNY